MFLFKRHLPLGALKKRRDSNFYEFYGSIEHRCSIHHPSRSHVGRKRGTGFAEIARDWIGKSCSNMLVPSAGVFSKYQKLHEGRSNPGAWTQLWREQLWERKSLLPLPCPFVPQALFSPLQSYPGVSSAVVAITVAPDVCLLENLVVFWKGKRYLNSTGRCEQSLQLANWIDLLGKGLGLIMYTELTLNVPCSLIQLSEKLMVSTGWQPPSSSKDSSGRPTVVRTDE